MGLNFRSPKGLGEIETSLLKGTYKISHIPGPRAKAVICLEPGPDLPASLGESPRDPVVAMAHLGDINTGSSHTWELSAAWTLMRAATIVGFSLRLISTTTWPHPIASGDTSGQTTNWAGKQHHPSAGKLPKDFLSPQPLLDMPLDTAYQRAKTVVHPPVSRHWPCPPENLYEPLDQPHPPEGTHQMQENHNPAA